MFKLYFFIELLIMPFFLYNGNTFRKGLLLGCFMALLFAGQSHPLLSLVPVIAAMGLSCAKEKKINPRHIASNGNSALPFFIIFVFIISLCYFCYKSTIYGYTEQSHYTTIQYKHTFYPLAVFSGPLLVGIWCDRRGPFAAAVFLCLSYATTIWLTINSAIYKELFFVAIFLSDFSLAGLFTIIPLISETCLGKNGELQTLIKLSFVLLGSYTLSFFFSQNEVPDPLSYDTFYITLLFLSGFALIFLYYAWKRRIIVVKDIKKIRRFSA